MRSKARAEVYIEQSGIPHTILRMPAIIGPQDTFATPAIVSSLLGGGFPYAVRRNRKVSILGIHNLAALLERVLEVGPLGEALNCTDHDVIWEDLVSQYAMHLRVVPFWIRHSVLRLLLRPQDRFYQYLMANSWFGAHFPSKKLWDRLGRSPVWDWRETVRDAVKAYHVLADSPVRNYGVDNQEERR
jgi:nucleoside-diphosphate-sugar epimerase